VPYAAGTHLAMQTEGANNYRVCGLSLCAQLEAAVAAAAAAAAAGGDAGGVEAASGAAEAAGAGPGSQPTSAGIAQVCVFWGGLWLCRG
jgi:hypothetical protein